MPLDIRAIIQQELDSPRDASESLRVIAAAAGLWPKGEQVPAPPTSEDEGNERQLIADVLAERAQQDQQWGGPTHDDTHGPWEWFNFIYDQRDKFFSRTVLGKVDIPTEARERLVKIAALAVAGIESIDRTAARREEH